MQQGSRIPSVEGCAPPPGGFATWDDYMHDVEQTHDIKSSDRFALTAAEADAIRRADYETNHLTSLRISKAMRLAPNAIVFKALLDGQPVPHEAMDQEWLPRYA